MFIKTSKMAEKRKDNLEKHWKSKTSYQFKKKEARHHKEKEKISQLSLKNRTKGSLRSFTIMAHNGREIMVYNNNINNNIFVTRLYSNFIDFSSNFVIVHNILDNFFN